MKLTPGMRFSSGSQSFFDVVGEGWTTSRHAWWRARKSFRNLRHPDASLYDPGPDESLDVLVRVPLEPSGLQHRFEREVVFNLVEIPWFLEPIDWLNAPDSPEAPLLVVPDPHARQLSTEGMLSQAIVVRLATELLAMLGVLHEAGLVAGVTEEDDFLVDATSRWFYCGTDRIGAIDRAGTVREDLRHWATLVDRLLKGSSSPAPAEPPLEADNREGQNAGSWLRERVDLCLSPTADSSPATVEELWHGSRARRSPLSALRAFFSTRSVTGRRNSEP